MGNLDSQINDWASVFGGPVETDGELMHFGVPGMKWGVRKVKEYIAQRKKNKKMKKLRKAKKLKAKMNKKLAKKAAKAEVKAAKNAKRRQKLLEKYMKNPDFMYKHRDKFTTDEINTAMRRFEAEQSLNKYRMTYLNRGQEYLSMLVKYGETGIKAYGLVKQFMGGGAADKASAIAEGAKMAKEATKQAKSAEKAAKSQEEAAKAQERAAKAHSKSVEKQMKAQQKAEKAAKKEAANNASKVERMQGEVVDDGYKFNRPSPAVVRVMNDTNWRSNADARQYNSSGERFVESYVINNPALLLEDKRRK